MDENLLASIFQTVGRLEAGQKSLDAKVDTLVKTVATGDDKADLANTTLELRVRSLERYKARVVGWCAGAAAMGAAVVEVVPKLL
jgi:cyanophycinase-like exopeptidase